MTNVGLAPSNNCDKGRVFTPESTKVTLSQACNVVGLDPSDAHLMRLGTNAVFRLTGHVVVRIARVDNLDEMARTVRVARWLASAGYPAVRALDVDQPVVIDGSAATFWEALSDGETYALVPEVAELIALLHSLVPPRDLELPLFEPFGRIEARLEMSTWLSDDDRAFLAKRLRDLRQRYAQLSFALPVGVIHGDANIGNVLRDDYGHPRLIDLDAFAMGPREWDLIQTAIFYDRFGWHSHEEYQSFVNIYGFDIMQWPGYEILRDIRALHMVTWLVQNADDSGEVAEEARKRINSLRTGSGWQDWRPY
jgi:Ser/Thr protein kinase RdoA (MazF antagonist)